MNDYTISSLFDIKGKKALVIGGTRGIGKEMSICLLENGCDVMAVSRKTDGNEETAAYAEELGVKFYLYSCDILNTEDVVKMVRYAEETMGRIDILINSAGRNIIKMTEDMDDASWDAVLDLNLKANFVVIREVLKIMKKQKYGKIVNLSSMKSVFGVSDMGYSAYCASKGAINMLTKQIACEAASDNITVNAIAPTFIVTDINRQLFEDPSFRESLEARIPIGRVGHFRDLMGLLLLLVSDASQFLTGQIYLVDGGISARQ